MSSEKVMYIFINRDLKMSAGKIAAQVGHSVGMCYERIEMQPNFIISNFENWKSNLYPKICLKATLEEINELIGKYNGEYVIDEGRTQIEPGSLTVFCLYPIDKTNDFRNFKLL